VDPQPIDGAVIAASIEDPSRFAAIFDRHYAEIQRYVARRVSSAEADDIAAETFVIALRTRRRYETMTPDARPWLYGIAANLLRRHWRRERRQLNAYARTGIDPLQHHDDQTAVDRRVDAQADAHKIAAALAALRPTDREVLLLFAWADLSYEEIAGALRIPVGTVRSRLARARARIRVALDGENQPTAFGEQGLSRPTEGEPT
jgi:RNA polymerase sigma-70 factor (ECF subfamily)